MINKKLIDWSFNSYGDLPWRNDKRSLYTTLVSEIMLQQTTVATVMKKYDGFLKKYPTINDLAKSSEKEVCKAWEGLGYYRRARNLRKAAIDITENYQSEFPTEATDLIKIPGIGDYTANALIAIGSNNKALAIDANIERVISRFYLIKNSKGPALHKEIKKRFLNNEILKNGEKYGYRQYHEALMDLGRIFCQAKKAHCHICPVSTKCLAYKSEGSPLSIPVVKEKTELKKKHELSLLRIFVENRYGLLVYERKEGQWLSGQVEVPTYIISTTDNDIKQYPVLNDDVDLKKLSSVKTAITKYKITNYKIEMSKKDFDSFLKRNKHIGSSHYIDTSKAHLSSACRKMIG
jgi:A/G-specific adenine glycosylase